MEVQKVSTVILLVFQKEALKRKPEYLYDLVGMNVAEMKATIMRAHYMKFRLLDTSVTDCTVGTS